MSRYTTEEADVTIVSDKGQIVIPAHLRKRLGLKPRSKLLVYFVKDAIVLKILTLPDMKKEMRSISKEIDVKTAKNGEPTGKEIQIEIERHRSKKRRAR